MQHVGVFKVIENFHSFFCKGDKDYQESFKVIQYFIQTKALGKLCSIPNKEGKMKENFIDFGVMKSLFNDIVLFNFYN